MAANENDMIRRYRGAFSKKECESVIKDIDFLEEHSLIGYNQDHLHLEDHKTINVCWNYDWDVCTTSRIASSVLPGFKPCIDEYLKTFSVLGRRNFLVYDCKVKKIPPGGGFHNWHYENGTIAYSPRALVIQLYLNDEFEGGETEFLYQNRREESVQGDVLIFPCYFTHTHRGNPPIGGTKYLATSWAVLQADKSDYPPIDKPKHLQNL